MQAVFLDDPVRPDALEERFFAYDCPRLGDQGHQDVESSIPKLNRLAVCEKLAAAWGNAEAAELDDRSGLVRDVHPIDGKTEFREFHANSVSVGERPPA